MSVLCLFVCHFQIGHRILDGGKGQHETTVSIQQSWCSCSGGGDSAVGTSVMGNLRLLEIDIGVSQLEAGGCGKREGQKLKYLMISGQEFLTCKRHQLSISVTIGYENSQLGSAKKRLESAKIQTVIGYCTIDSYRRR